MTEWEKIVTYTLKAAVGACLAELVLEPDNADDETYNRAIRHCVEAIRRLDEGVGR